MQPCRIIFYLLAGLQLCLTTAFGQIRTVEQLPEPARFGEVPDSLFIFFPDYEEPFEYLLRQTRIRFEQSGDGIHARLEHLFRIRVYGDDPVDLAEASLVGIPYYAEDGMERIVELEAATHFPDGRRLELAPGEVRHADLNVRYRIAEFLFPQVESGTILEYRYVVHRRYIDELPDFYFSHGVPTRRAHLILYNEDYLRYDAVGVNIDFRVGYREERIDTSDVPPVFTYRRPEPLSIEHWYAEEVPAVDRAEYISSLQDLRGMLKLQISEFGRPRQPLENSWDFIAAQIRRGPLNPYDTIDRLEKIRSKGAELAAGEEGERAVLHRIFHHLNDSMVYNGEFRSFPESDPEEVLRGTPSDQAAVNLVLLALLEGAGIEVYPAFLSGRESGTIHLDLPSLYQFTQMLLLVRAEDEEYWLDGSFPDSRPGMIPVESWSRHAMLFGRERYEWREIEPQYSKFDLDVTLKAELNEQGDLNGRIEMGSEGYPARRIRQSLAGDRSAAGVIRETFFDAYESAILSQASIRESEPWGYPLKMEAEFEIPGYALSFREGLQFHPMVIGYLQQNPFDDPDRTVPVTLDAPEQVEVRYEIGLPSGFEFEQMRDRVQTVLAGAGLYEEYEISGHELNYTFRVRIDRKEFSTDEYSDLRRLYDRWVYLSTTEWFISRGESR